MSEKYVHWNSTTDELWEVNADGSRGAPIHDPEMLARIKAEKARRQAWMDNSTVPAVQSPPPAPSP